jgi:hypothetical protein
MEIGADQLSQAVESQYDGTAGPHLGDIGSPLNAVRSLLWRSVAANWKVDDQGPEMPMYAVMLIVAFFIAALALPVVLWLTKRVRPPKPEEEAIHRRVEEARRRIDRIPH